MRSPNRGRHRRVPGRSPGAPERIPAALRNRRGPRRGGFCMTPGWRRPETMGWQRFAARPVIPAAAHEAVTALTAAGLIVAAADQGGDVVAEHACIAEVLHDRVR